MTQTKDTLAAVSLAMADQDPDGFADRIGRSFADWGFAVVADHGIPAELIERAEAMSRAFFALPEDVKRSYHIVGGGGARGYTPFGTESAKDSDIQDLKEFWHIGRDLPADHPFEPYMPPNVWPKELDGFRETYLEMFAAFDQAGARILEAIARFLDLSPDFFVDTVRDGNSVMRLIHYPPVPEDSPAVRSGAHEDINTITLLIGAEEAGLELLDRQGNWRAVTPKAGELAVNIGDMLQRLTNDRLPSTTHRVVNPAPERRGFSRYSMPFFLHFRPDYLIETLPSCVDDNHPNRYPEPITAHDYLQQRLREIGLI
ncbi:MAG: isopenicillin N synthase family oxygenase [Sphingomonadales bacterium]|nr:isopenicillin N synthase family oxygenase [Sphingomonadales bacterium]PIX66390.1 MAG: flavonol synthase [Sphingomonadales bacterium CG_4_10_14_3_um_filter_58_15]NCO99816.1 isopenicillin N synthase family oxygenase [Sphingomonadales bacterium]NCP28132.1 isopenicillin N synthase family oxygenase [Sphingomonadales bacterium]NCP42364.1 isopenicillin N synthase family oxygenase [Sphingomonadales bacterium]